MPLFKGVLFIIITVVSHFHTLKCFCENGREDRKGVGPYNLRSYQSILCSEVSSLLLLANWDFLSPEMQLQASSHNYKGIIFIPYCKIKWFHLFRYNHKCIKGLTIKCNYMTTLLTTDLLVYYNGGLEVYWVL